MRKELSDTLTAMRDFVQKKNDKYPLKISDLARKFGCSRGLVEKCLDRLVKEGLVVREKLNPPVGRQSNSYFVGHDPKVFPSDIGGSQEDIVRWLRSMQVGSTVPQVVLQQKFGISRHKTEGTLRKLVARGFLEEDLSKGGKRSFTVTRPKMSEATTNQCFPKPQTSLSREDRLRIAEKGLELALQFLKSDSFD